MSHLLSHYPPEYITDSMLGAADTLLEELADEATRYLRLLERLRHASTDDEREDLEADLYASISHFKSHSVVTLECLDDLVDALPEEDEVHA